MASSTTSGSQSAALGSSQSVAQATCSIVDDLVRQGVDDAVARAAVGPLPVEAERAAAIVERRGRSARTLRYLASRGFSEDSLEPLIADIGSGALR